ncbi:MAG: hypothetical protein L6437_01820 [Kiritimatiellae bacterium]|nr:hypothetical protein [Kiritimatiellia bacterium]
MNDLTESYLKVQYALRPAKQVERRMLIDAFHLLAEATFPVWDYQYTGMGSIHFVDFAMFHKYLGIQSMVSVELSHKIQQRVQFNAPYKNAVNVETGRPIGDVIPELPLNKCHVLWLDYDNVLSDYMLRDIALAASILPARSILLMTVDTEPPGDLPTGNKHTQHNYNPEVARSYYETIAGKYLIPNAGETDFLYDCLPSVSVKAMTGAIRDGEQGRADVKFRPLFNFQYADGHRMTTIGGIIASSRDKKRIQRSRFAQAPYARFSLTSDPCHIRVPCLTRKEQMYLDENMPRKTGWIPNDFELSNQEISDYSNIYRFFPTYAELFI